ncbi:MAG: hypothetical protein EZS28_045666, partial [Streblomastix strix]
PAAIRFIRENWALGFIVPLAAPVFPRLCPGTLTQTAYFPKQVDDQIKGVLFETMLYIYLYFSFLFLYDLKLVIVLDLLHQILHHYYHDPYFFNLAEVINILIWVDAEYEVSKQDDMRSYQSLCFQLPNSQAFHPLRISVLYSVLFDIYGFVSELLIVLQNPYLLVTQQYLPKSQEDLEVFGTCIILELVVSEDYEVDFEGQRYNQPDVALVGVCCFDQYLRIGVLVDFQKSAVLTNWGVGPPICLRIRFGTTVFEEVAGTDSTGGHGSTLNKL